MKKEKYNYNILSEAEKKKIQKQFHEGDLNYLASFSIEDGTLTESDLNDLHSRIDKKIKGNSSSGFAIFVALLSGIFIGISIFFVFFQKGQTHSPITTREYSEPLKTKVKVLATVEVKNKVTAESDHRNEHFSVTQAGEQLNPPKEEYTELPIKSIDKLETPPSQPEPELILEYIPNAPIIFIHDLKVANYKVYYFKDNREINIDEHGLAAPFEHKAEKALLKNDEQHYYAHELIKDALEHFNSKHYTNCIELLNLLYRYNKDDVNSEFYLGMSYYYSGDLSKAQVYFDEVLDNRVNIFIQEAEFYKAVCLVGKGETESAKTLLKTIISKKLFYKNRAEETLRKLED